MKIEINRKKIRMSVMIPNIDGLFYLVYVGMAAMVVALIVAPPAIVFGICWLGESRIGVDSYAVWAWSQGIWVVGVALATMYNYCNK